MKYLDGLPDPPGAAARFGTEVHAVLEAYLRDGTEPDTSTRAGKLAAKGLDLYPEAVAFVEEEIIFDRGGILFRGFIDAAWEDDEDPTISDHKTSSNPAKWGLTPAMMPTDPQALIYSAWALDYWGSSAVNLQWTYYQTRGAAVAFPVRGRITREQAQDQFETLLDPIARGIVDARAAFEAGSIEGANALPAKPSACGDFGGCPYAEFCERSPDEAITAIFGPKTKDKDKNKMGLKEMLAAKKGRKMAPPRVDELPPPTREANVIAINPPEAPPSPEVAREVSRAVGQATGNAATKKAKAREIANAAAGANTPEDARAATLETLERVEPAAVAPTPAPAKSGSKAKSLTQAEVLALVCEGTTHQFTGSSSKGTDARPYVHGRTLKAMQKYGLIKVWEDHPESGIRTVMPTDHGREKYAATQKPTTGSSKPAKAPEPEAPAAAEPAAPEPVEPEDTKPDLTIRKSNDLPPITGEIVTSTAPSHPEVFFKLLAITEDAQKAGALFDAFCERFPMP
jgi:hypothetical protein